MSDASHILQVDGLTFEYRPGEPVLSGVEFQAATGRLCCLLGPNGSGKTTLLRCMLGLLPTAGGNVMLDGKPAKKHSRRELARLMAYVPQFPQSPSPSPSASSSCSGASRTPVCSAWPATRTGPSPAKR